MAIHAPQCSNMFGDVMLKIAKETIVGENGKIYDSNWKKENTLIF